MTVPRTRSSFRLLLADFCSPKHLEVMTAGVTSLIGRVAMITTVVVPPLDVIAMRTAKSMLQALAVSRAEGIQDTECQ